MGKWSYGVVLDAGSSGTRAYVYRWLDNEHALKSATTDERQSLPKLETKKKWTKKIHPGISTLGGNPKSVPRYLKELFDHALDVVPSSQVSQTPLFLLATAGVRLLPDGQRNELLHQVCAYAQTTGFLVPDCDLHVQTITGETEGLYGWTAANYLLGGFDSPEDHQHGKGHHTYGFLDMGGASAQIAFAPNATESEKHANDLKLMRLRTVDGTENEYRVFVTTWLGFGANEARRRYLKSLLERGGGAGITEVADPCLPRGATTHDDGPISAKNPVFKGVGDFAQCLKETIPLLDKDAPCEDDPCLIHGVHVPAIDFDVNHFVGVSEYWHTTHDIFEMDAEDKAYDFKTYQSRVSAFCSRDWDKIQKDVASNKWKKVDEDTAREICFKASWLINILHEGIGVPRVGLDPMKGGHNGTKEVLDKVRQKGFDEAFKPFNKIHGTDVSWTLGKMVLYASSQVPPRAQSLPVGFGANVKGIPPDFQFAGQYRPVTATSKSRKLPTFFLIIVILMIALLLIMGQDRRKNFFRKIRRFARQSRRRRLISSNGFVTYEHVRDMEGDVELGDIESDPEDVVGSGMQTPASDLRNPLDRKGLVMRTESRERLGVPRSRNASPIRARSPLTMLSSHK